jgi:hypothetical protein
LVFQVIGLSKRFKDITCIEYTLRATKGVALWESLKSVIKACEEEVGILFVSIALDMNTDNISMLNQAKCQ